MTRAIHIDQGRLADFCRRRKIVEMSLFGSVLRDDFRDDSDVDVLVQFAPDATWSLGDHAAMQAELTAILGRRVDLVSRRGLERSRNWLRRKSIFEEARRIYAA